MATIKAIEGRSVHQIQSGQVIVDLCSVVKELVENSLDAGSTSIDVRFKNNGLESIEVQDNGAGISPDDYETIALKHYTSKLATYNDLESLATFGFRGEALSSLCALSKFHITTARDGEAPKGTKLEFEVSGKLKNTSVAACQKGTTVTAEELFYNLPVRRRELEKNIKREYGKVLANLNAYACISTGVRFAVSNQPGKGKKTVVFSTKSNLTTRENIANVYGAKTLSALVPLDLELLLEPTASGKLMDSNSRGNVNSRRVLVAGHISRPVFGEGRQTPDRQMFFVNSRPCGLPQIAKAFNEVYKSYNISQSPFIFANFQMDTNSYDVNVSPDKRSIMLHDQNALLETLKESLVNLFEAQEQTVPQSQLAPKLSAFRPLNFPTEHSAATSSTDNDAEGTAQDSQDEIGPPIPSSQNEEDIEAPETPNDATSLIQKFMTRDNEGRIPGEVGQLDRRIGHSSANNLHDRTPSYEPGKEQSETVPRSLKSTTFDPGTAVSQSVQEADSRRSRSTSSPLDAHLRKQNVNFQLPTSSNSWTTAPDPHRTGSRGNLTTTVASHKKRRIHIVKDPASSQSLARFANKLKGFSSHAHNDQTTDSDDEVDSDSEHEPTQQSQKSRGAAARSDSDGKEDLVEDGSDDEYIDEEEKKKREDFRVAEMLRQAEASAALPTRDNRKRAEALLNSRTETECAIGLTRTVKTSVQDIETSSKQLSSTTTALKQPQSTDLNDHTDPVSSQTSPEERLSLTISKADFANMRIAGQFNLGFILATRIKDGGQANNHSRKEDLFIIDQHASDEIYNFSKLSNTTKLTPQPLAYPHLLDLTAIEEEIILSHTETLSKNGFKIVVDTSGDAPVGQRCKLLTLPTSKETVFDTQDLEELIALLGEASLSATSDREIVRPSKVRRMLAMRACRSSIMVGRTLTRTGMETVVRHMGEIDRPWNCPHGRPTMRHLTSLADWAGWTEDSGLVDDRDEIGTTDWSHFIQTARAAGLVGASQVTVPSVSSESEEDGDEIAASSDEDEDDQEEREES